MRPGIQCLYLVELLVFRIFVVTGHAEEPCELRALSSEVFVPLGEWVLLNCTFSCPTRSYWESRLQKKNSQSGPNWMSVEVLVDDWEKSEVYCMQSSEDQSTRQSMLVVTAYALPSRVTIDLDQELEEGKAHFINCTVYDVAPVENLQIQLLRDDTVIRNTTFKEDGQRGKQRVETTYEVTARRMDNGHNFSCLTNFKVATGVFNTVSSSGVSVRTYGPPDVPVVTIIPESNIHEGDSVNITCISDGSPSPDYHWFIPTGANVTYTQRNAAVSVTRATLIHHGNYTCEARNAHGWVRSSQSLQVTPLTTGHPRSRKGDIISAVFVFIIASFILWKTRIRNSVSRGSV